MTRIILILSMTIISLIVISITSFGQTDPDDCNFRDDVWLLKGDRRALSEEDDPLPGVGTSSDHGFVAVVIMPEEVCSEVIQAAWSYAVRYSADGLDLPNYEAAVDLMLERHPSWNAGVTNGITIGFRDTMADLDMPEIVPEATSDSDGSD